MNFEYVFSYTEQNNLRMEIMPNSNIEGDLTLLTEWLISDVSTGSGELPKVKKVMETEEETIAEIWGNAFIATVKKDYTIIKWAILDLPNFCKIPTQMLYEILQIWTERFNKDLKNKNS